jgi:predicted transglutaminase-like cysteine proteinase
MKKLFAVVFISSCILLGCGSSETYLEKKISDWTDREWECLECPIYRPSQGDYSLATYENMEEIVNSVYESMSYYPDGDEDHWQTSCESMTRGKGDCEDFAILQWRKLRDIGLPDDINGIFIIKQIKGSHAVTAVKLSDNDFFILDATGVMGAPLQKLSYFAERPKITIWFNLFEMYYID